MGLEEYDVRNPLSETETNYCLLSENKQGVLVLIENKDCFKFDWMKKLNKIVVLCLNWFYFKDINNTISPKANFFTGNNTRKSSA